jgi:hypothetical protein
VYSFPANVTPAMTDKWSRLCFSATTGVCPFGHPFQGGSLISLGPRKIKGGKEIRPVERALS